MPQFSRFNAIQQDLDIAGSPTQTGTRTLTDETGGLGAPLSGQTGSAASIGVVASGIAPITGLTGMTANSVGNWLTITGAASAGNNGTFLIVAFTSATAVSVANSTGVSSDANNGALAWTERGAYTLNDDLDCERSDRQAIKGVNYDQPIPTYQRASAVGTNVPANLSNIAGKTLDAYARSVSRGKFKWPVEVTLTDLYGTSAYKHSDSVDTTGVPVFDSAPFTGDWNTCYVEVTDSSTGDEIVVLSGGHTGEKIFGITYDGTSTSPNSVEIHWYSAPNGSDITTSATAYSWEQGTATANTGTGTVVLTASTNGATILTGLTGSSFTSANVGNWLTLSSFANATNNGTFVIISVQSSTAITVQNHAAVSETTSVTWTEHLKTVATFVDLTYGYNQRLDQLDQNAFRFPFVSGLVGDADLRLDINNILSTIGSSDGETSLATLLTNTGANYPFFNLGTATPSVVIALNTLNAQIGDRSYTGPYLTNGQSIVASLQALSSAIGTSAVVRYIERIASTITANTSHLLPGGATYTLDGTNNGLHLWVFWRGILRDPGSVANGDDYAETDTTHVTPYAKWNKNDHVNYFVH